MRYRSKETTPNTDAKMKRRTLCHEVFCGELGEHIKHVHFSDNRSRSDDHMPLGVGTVNWKKVVSSLKATGYNSTITLEIFCNDPNMQHKYLDLSRELILELWA